VKLNRNHCFLHPERGAVARCPECGRFYCRECITEHEGEVLCRRCLLADVSDPGALRQRRRGVALLLLKPLCALAVYALLWLLFMALGTLLIHFPDSFYEPVAEARAREAGPR
jgi:hypothetical protein